MKHVRVEHAHFNDDFQATKIQSWCPCTISIFSRALTVWGSGNLPAVNPSRWIACWSIDAVRQMEGHNGGMLEIQV